MSANAQTTYDWLNNAPDGFWRQGASGARWSGGFFDEPPFGILRFNNDHQLTMNNNVQATYSFHQIIFGSFNTSSRTISGNAIRLFDFNGADPKIENQSSASHILSLNIAGDGDAADPLEINPVSGDLTLNGTLTNNGSPIRVFGANAKTLTIVGIISGTGAFTVEQASNVVFTAQNTYTGLTTISAGTLRLNRTGGTSIPVTNNLTVNGGTLRISTDQTIANLTMSTGTLQVDAGITLTITSTYSVSGGTINNLGTISLNSSTVSFPGTGATINNGTANTMTNLTIANNSAVTLTTGFTVAGTLTATSGTLTVGANTLTISGSVPVRTSGSIDASNASATVAFTNASTFTLPASLFTGNINNLTVNGGGITLGSATTVQGALTLTSGKLAIGSNTLTLNGTVASLDANKSLSTTTSSNISIGGIGSLGILFFDAGSNNLNNLTINRTSSGLVTLGNALRLSGVLTPTAGQLATGGFLTLVSTTTTGGGAIADASANSGNAANYISGTVTVQRLSQAQRGYRMLGHPFTTTQTLGLLTNTFLITGLNPTGGGTYASSSSVPTAFLYDPTQVSGSASILTRITDGTANVWTPGRGLYVFVRGAGFEGINGFGVANYTNNSIITHSLVTITGTGTINQGNVTYTLGFQSGSDNFNLVGNPYPCPINLKAVTNIGIGILYVYNPRKNVGSLDQYTLRGGFDPITSNGSNDIIIPSFGAFYIQATAATVLTFKESDKITSIAPNVSIFGTNTQPKFRITASTVNGYVDDVLFGLNSASSDASNDVFDGVKLSNAAFNLYSLSSDAKALTIDYRANLNNTIPLGVQTNIIGKYSISLSEFTDMPNTQLALKDKLLNIITPLSTIGDSYSFDITADAATKGENRFEIGLLGNIVLPTTLTSLTAQLQSNSLVAVNWVSATEVNTSYYNVQRSNDGSSFSTVGKVAAKGASAYSYTDDVTNVATPTIYYRLEMVDKDGSITYSKVVAVALGNSVANKALSIYPNPVQATLFAKITESKAGKVTVVVTDMQGKQLRQQTAAVNAGVTALSVDASGLAAGNYVLVITNSDGEQQKQQFVKK